jgi:hypothetical protein
MVRLPLQCSTAASLTSRNTSRKRFALRSGARLFPSAARIPWRVVRAISEICRSTGLHRGDSAQTEADAITFPDLPLLWTSFSSTASRSMNWFGLRGSVRSSLRERLRN